jgi:hypothetical protein
MRQSTLLPTHAPNDHRIVHRVVFRFHHPVVKVPDGCEVLQSSEVQWSTQRVRCEDRSAAKAKARLSHTNQCQCRPTATKTRARTHMVPFPEGGVPASMKPVYIFDGSAFPNSDQPGSDVIWNLLGGARTAATAVLATAAATIAARNIVAEAETAEGPLDFAAAIENATTRVPHNGERMNRAVARRCFPRRF